MLLKNVSWYSSEEGAVSALGLCRAGQWVQGHCGQGWEHLSQPHSDRECSRHGAHEEEEREEDEGARPALPGSPARWGCWAVRYPAACGESPATASLLQKGNPAGCWAGLILGMARHHGAAVVSHEVLGTIRPGAGVGAGFGAGAGVGVCCVGALRWSCSIIRPAPCPALPCWCAAR